MHKYHCSYLNNYSMIPVKKVFFYFSGGTGSVCWENVGEDPTIKKKKLGINIKNCKTSTELLLCGNHPENSKISEYRSICHVAVCLSDMKTGKLFVPLTNYHNQSAIRCSAYECSVRFPAFRNAAGERLLHQNQHKNIFQILSNTLHVGEIQKATSKPI